MNKWMNVMENISVNGQQPHMLWWFQLCWRSLAVLFHTSITVHPVLHRVICCSKEKTCDSGTSVVFMKLGMFCYFYCYILVSCYGDEPSKCIFVSICRNVGLKPHFSLASELFPVLFFVNREGVWRFDHCLSGSWVFIHLCTRCLVAEGQR